MEFFILILVKRSPRKISFSGLQIRNRLEMLAVSARAILDLSDFDFAVSWKSHFRVCNHTSENGDIYIQR